MYDISTTYAGPGRQRGAEERAPRPAIGETAGSGAIAGGAGRIGTERLVIAAATVTGTALDDDLISGGSSILGRPLNDGIDDIQPGLPPDDDTIFGLDGDDLIAGGAGNDRLDGGKGDDEVYGETGDDFLITGDGKDTLLGGAGNDILDAGAGTDTLWGGPDDDTLFGGSGPDRLDGGTGNDFASYSDANQPVSVSLVTGGTGVSGGAVGDQYSEIEGLIGSAFGDTLEGDGLDNTLIAAAGNDIVAGLAGKDTLFGGGGGDTLEGGSGADSLDGGNNIDMASYAQAAAAIVTNLKNGSGTGGEASGDSYSSIEGLIGSDFADRLTGDDFANTILGGDGADIIFGGLGDDLVSGGNGDDSVAGGEGDDSVLGLDGNDQLGGGTGGDSFDGGNGLDTVTYAKSTAAVVVSLGGVGSGGHAAGDRFVRVENLVGSDFGDRLTGNNTGNLLEGGAAGDTLNGGGGNDTLDGGAGGDRLNGGTGLNIASYQSAAARVVVSLAGGSGTGDAAGDSFVFINGLIGSDFNDRITGNGANNTLFGGDGDDQIFGNGGSDRIAGGAGDDTMTGAQPGQTTGTDGGDVFVFKAGSGNDTIRYFLADQDDRDTGGDDRVGISALRPPSKLDFSGHTLVDSFADLTRVQQGRDLLIRLPGGDSILLIDQNIAQFTATDCIF